MIKQNQFYVLKLKSSRLHEGKYDINLPLDQARKYKELIQLGDNQILRSLRKLKNDTIDFEYIKKLKKEKKRLTNSNPKENIKRIIDIQNELDKLLYVPEYIAVIIDKTKEYDRIFKLGFKINGRRYRRFSCSSSQGRVNTVIFVDEQYNEELKTILMNGLDENIPLVPNKLNAYFGLNSSCIYKVTTPRVCIIPDKEVKMIKKVDFIDDENNVESAEREIVANLWDGAGIISPKMAKHWARNDLGILDYIPSYFIARSNWIKGSLFVFDFHRFASEVAKKKYIKNIYGKEVNIYECDVLISESQFKMWKNYSSMEDYQKRCEENDLVWGVTRVAPKTLNDYTTTNYQFIQTLELNDGDIEGLLSPTIDWISGVLNNNPFYTILFMNGSFEEVDGALKSLKESQNPYIKALILNPKMIDDPYIRKKVHDSIKKKILEAMLGKILINGNFQIMCSDPWGFCEHAFGMEVKGLLKEFEHYCEYWSKKGVRVVDAMRSPLTWKSEHNLLNLQYNRKLKEWYKYLYGTVIYNVWGTDCMRHADGDFDGDLVCTTDNKYFIKGVNPSLLPITYNKNIANKVVIDSEEILMQADKQSFNSKIGQITNVSTKLYAMLPLFEIGSNEYEEIIRRLKLLRKEQGNEIDRAKGVKVKPFNNEWTVFNKILESDSEEEKSRKEFNNRILADKKPYFMIYLYNSTKKEYLNHIKNCDTYSQIKFGITMKELLNKKNKNQDELNHVEYYYKLMPVNISDCLMNKICRYVEKVNEEIFKVKLDRCVGETVNLMIDNDIPFDNTSYNLVKKLYHEYKKYKREDIIINDYEIDYAESTDNQEDFNLFNNINELFRKKILMISSDIRELANYAVRLCYIEENPINKDFLWHLCKSGLLENIKKNSGGILHIPIKSADGDVMYLGNRYKIEEVRDV